MGAWRGTSNTVSRALALIEAGALDEGDVDGLAGRLGVGERHLRRLFRQHLGAAPVSVAQTRRVLLAKALIHQTDLSMAEVALASGFGSVRRFNETFQALYGRPPSALRRRGERLRAGGVRLSLPYRPPYDWDAMFAALRARGDAVEGRRWSRPLTKSMDGANGAVTVEPAIESLDTLAREMMFQVNKVHSQSQGQIGITSVTGLNRITNAVVPLNSTEIPFAMRNGAFELHVKSLATGLRTTVTVSVDPATATLTDLRNAVNAAIPAGTASASITADNTLRLDANAGYELSFANDTSGVLAGLGINSIFGGYDAKTIEINSQVLADPRLLAVARDHVPGSNGGALAIAALSTNPIEALGGRSIRGFWTASTTELGVRAEAANNRAESTALVRESLDSQIQALSGVSIDEESINMLAFQRQFQAAARFITAIDETIQQLLRL
jgi:AraC-like DNA-binding protein